MKKKKKWRHAAGLFLFPFLMAVSGCAGTAPAEDTMILLEHETEDIVYQLTIVEVADVVKTQRVSCVYRQVQDEDLSFPLSGRQVKAVYVKTGDSVVKGQLLAELDNGDTDTRLRDLRYRIAKNELLLSFCDADEEEELSWQVDEAGREAVRQKYGYLREDYEDAIALDKFELETLLKDIEDGCLYAGMDGIVSFVKPSLAGSTCTQGEKVMTVIDSSDCLFEVKETKYGPYFKEGEAVNMDIVYGSGKGKYKVLPFDMEHWTDTFLFVLDGETENVSIEVGTTGAMTLVLGKSEQVLAVPTGAVHTADGRSYVYVEGENNFREIKWIETGLTGDTLVEVLSGLSEGERVIIQ